MSNGHPPPLLGDEQGRYRVHVVGNCVGKELARILRLPFISLDPLKQETNEQFRKNVEKALADAPDGWVVDGNYRRLDPPLVLYFPRIVIRTFLRLFGLAEVCSPGCCERFQYVFFSRESMILWCLTHHGLVRRREGARMPQIGLGVGMDVEGQKMRRLGG
ncbi:hypothetical protein C8R43DRAFT_1093948 [Mycena crocata]|nr:hypothetical protein C8R43DRAFT_1093948 [Mycena crocata]